MKKIVVILAALLILATQMCTAQTPKNNILTRILFIFDYSYSMIDTWNSRRKIDAARDRLTVLLDSVEKLENVELALRLYGHQKKVPPQDCNDSKLEIPFGPHNADGIRKKLAMYQPKGTTPIAHSLELAADDFPKCNTCRNVIILITDGIEACNGDPCAVAASLEKRGICMKPFIIGVGLDVRAKKTFECMGHYYDATTEDNYTDALKSVIAQIISNTTAQVNLNDIKGLPTETNVNMTFMDQNTGQIKANWYHTMNAKGVPDTLALDPGTTYQLLVHTIPPIKVNNIKLKPGHNIISANAPQGTLLVKCEKPQSLEDVEVIVRKATAAKTLNVQQFNAPEKYIVGRYDLEVLTLPRMYYNDVEVKQSQTTTITLPQPGVATILMPGDGVCSVFLMEGKSQVRLIYTLHTPKVALTLLPGKYLAVFRYMNAKQTTQTVNQGFEIKSGYSQYINFEFDVNAN